MGPYAAVLGRRSAEIRGKEITPHYLGKLLRAFAIESRRERLPGMTNPVHSYHRNDFLDAWERYVSGPAVSGTSGTTDTASAQDPRSTAKSVPDVPLVPDAEHPIPEETADLAAIAWRIFGEDAEFFMGTA